MTASIVLKFLVLLLTGLNSISFSFPVNISEEGCISKSNITEIEEGFTFVYESNLLEISLIDNCRYIFQRSCDFTLSNYISEKTDLEYINQSNNIQPGLSTEKIIFPFHSFL